MGYVELADGAFSEKSPPHTNYSLKPIVEDGNGSDYTYGTNTFKPCADPVCNIDHLALTLQGSLKDSHIEAKCNK